MAPPGVSAEHLYVHIPFCAHICPYCAFHKHGLGPARGQRDFVAALIAEARRQRSALATPHSAHFGGGTPSVLANQAISDLFHGIDAALGLAWPSFPEIAWEANPRSLTAAKARLLRAQGVTRLSIGVQSWSERTLRALGREHSPEAARAAHRRARAAGIPLIGHDLIFGVPGQSLADWRRDLEATLAMRPDSISCYALTIERGTPFHAGRTRSAPDDAQAEMIELADALLRAAGHARIEVSNWARPGAHSQHNAAIWRGEDYLGLGPGAVSAIGGRRWRNLPDTPSYIAALLAGDDPPREIERRDPERRRIERIALGLRTAEGIEASELSAAARARLPALSAAGLVSVEAERIRPSARGMLLADSLAAELA